MCVWVRNSTIVTPVRPLPPTPVTPEIVVSNANAFGPPVVLYREPRLVRVTTSPSSRSHSSSVSHNNHLLFAKHQSHLSASLRGNSTTSLRGYPAQIFKVDFVHTLPSEYNQVSVMAENYRAENSIIVTLAGVVLSELHIPASHKCGNAIIVTAPYDPGAIITLSHLAGETTSTELFLRLESKPRDFVDCVTCPAGYIVTSGTCVSCGENTYNPNTRGLECISCPAGTRSPPGSSDLKHCRCRGEESGTCGLTGPDGGFCRVCPEQHYKSITGSGSCDKITNFRSAISLPHAIGTPVRNILDRGF